LEQLETKVLIPTNLILALEASVYQDDFHEFVKAAWHVVEPDVPFVDGWHIQAICKYLEAVYENKIGDLIINVPPRHMKSLLTDVFFPAWVWTKRPSKKFMCLSYAETTIAEHAKKCKRLLKSEWYQTHFDVTMMASPDTDTKFANTNGGHVYSFGFKGAYTGQGADYILIDDPLKADDADSDAERLGVNKAYDDAVGNRLNDPKTGHRIIIMQRLHQLDLVGHIIEEKKLPFEHLVLPAEYEGVLFESSIGFVDPRTETGELLWEERFDSKWLANEKLRMTERGASGQLQQRPTPAGGFIFKNVWFPRLHDNEAGGDIYISWDTAESINPDAAYSCGVVGELLPDYTLFPREVFRERLLFPQLQDAIMTLAEKYRHRLKGVIIEYKSSGIQATQTLKQQSPEWLMDLIIPFTPKGDKDARQYQSASFCEKGCVLLPHPSGKFLWLKDFEDELFKQPSAAFRDQADAFSQLILYLRSYLSEGWRARTHNLLEAPSIEGAL
jgi:predicted phage terminase large subunit-like protein